ncbi:MAG: C4-dicarboxylate ABC transporter permease [Desulfobacterales bacterium]|nr:MAG: C4-dicarboxylate ABC transporter permease [Desulfobacterales bacterium]
MSNLSTFCLSLSNRIEQLCLFLAGLLLAVNLLAVMLGVFARFFRPPVWTSDLAKVTLVWMVMLAAAPALKRGEHMAILILVEKLPAVPRRVVTVCRTLVFFAILILMIWLGVQYAYKMRFFTIMTLGVKKAVPLASIPIGMGLMLIEYILQQGISLDTLCVKCKEKL